MQADRQTDMQTGRWIDWLWTGKKANAEKLNMNFVVLCRVAVCLHLQDSSLDMVE